MSMEPTHVVVDTRDGYTWAKDGHGQPLTEETAAQMAQAYNDEMKPEYRTYQVFKLVHVPLATLHEPKVNDRFIHRSYLAAGAVPPYDSEDSYQVRVVTEVEHGDGYTVVYHAREGSTQSDRTFLMSA